MAGPDIIVTTPATGLYAQVTCANCAHLQAENERLRSVLAEAKKELMGWHMIGDPRPYPQSEEPFDWNKVDEYYDDFEKSWESKFV